MSKEPERIWVPSHIGECGQYFPSAVEAEGEYGGVAQEYIRADLIEPELHRVQCELDEAKHITVEQIKAQARKEAMTVQEAAKVLLSVDQWSDMAKAFSAMDARWEDGPEAVLSSALRALAEKEKNDG